MSEPVTTPLPPLPARLPVIPLRGTVVFPLTLQPLAVNRPVSVDSVNRALGGDRLVLLVQQTGDVEDPGPDAIREIGTVGVIRQMAKGPAAIQIVVEGLVRARLTDLSRAGNALDAAADVRPDDETRELEVEAYVQRLRDLSERALSFASGLPQDLKALVAGIDQPLRLCYVVASMLDLKGDDKQRLLEEDRLVAKLQAVAKALAREVTLLELKGKIESEAQQEMSEAQREYYLRQQLKAIREELGDSEGADTRELAERIEQARLPEHVRKVAEREARRLERTTPASPEYQMIRTYLDWLLEVPWSVSTDDRLDPVEARRVLDEDHYDLDRVKDRIVEYLAVRKLKGDMKGPILCFVGPPGVGKTSLGQSIARSMNRKFVRISLGGVRDEAEIRGHRRTYIGAIPGRIVQALKQAGAVNPVLMLDEIDKVSRRLPGRPRRGAARGARPGAEPQLPRSLPRGAGRPVARAVHRQRQPARHRAPRAARPHGNHRARRLYRPRESADRPAVSDPAPDGRARAALRSRRHHGAGARPAHRRVHARSRRPEPRAPARHHRAQSRRARRRPP